MADNTVKILIGAAILFYLFGQGGIGQQATGGTTGETGGPTVISPGCNYAPTVQLGANDKYTSGQANWGNWKYILNGGTATTDSDGSFEVAKGDKLIVLVADSNSTAYYRAKWEKTIDQCGTQPMAYNDVIKVGYYSVKCFNDISQVINGTTYTNANYTVGTGGVINSKCELTTTAKTGIPYGALVILELNSTTYKENDLSIQWNGATIPQTALPGAFKLALSTGTAKAFEIPAMGSSASQVIQFYVNAQAESDKDPTSGGDSIDSYGNGIVGYIIPKNCYEEEDVSPSEFRCGYEDLDGTFTAPAGTTKTAAIATLWIPVI